MGFFSNIFKSKDSRPAKYSSDGYFDYAQRQEKKGNYQEAADCYEIIIKKSPGYKEVYLPLFECLRYLRQWKKMIDYGNQFENQHGIWKLEWGRNAVLEAQSEMSREYEQSQKATNKGNNKSSPLAHPNDDKGDAPKQGFVITTKNKNGVDVKEVTLVDATATTADVEVKPEPKSKAKWPDKANFSPKDDGKKTFGAKYDSFCSKFPPYKFFEHEPKIPQAVIEQHQGFIQVLADAKVTIAGEEEKEDYQSAADCCEVLTQGECWEPWPYTKLMELYQKAGLSQEAEELRQYAIDFFTKRRTKMEQQVLQCTEQQDELEIIKQRIAEGKPIRYYRGLFYLYNPYPCIAEWKAMGDLSKTQ